MSQPHAPRSSIAWMVENPVASNLVMLLLLLGGVYTALTMQKEVLPQFLLDQVEITVTYPGAAPAEVETGVLMPIEEAVRGVQGIKEIVSFGAEGQGIVTIELVSGTDRMRAFQDIDQAISRIRTFPEDIEDPEVRLLAQTREVMTVGLYGEVSVWNLRQQAERLRERLLSDPTITQVELGRVPDFVTHVEVPRRELRKYGLTLGDIAELIAASSRDIPAGAVETQTGEVLLRMQERKQWAEELAGITLLASSTGANVRLGDIADITDGFEEIGFHSEFNRTPSVDLLVSRVGDQSPLEISEAVQAVLADFARTAPPGLRTRIDRNAADEYADRLSLLLENAWIAVLIVFAILSLFLELRLAFWVMVGMSVAFIGGVALLPIIGVSINMISMFGFLVVLGIVVDDAIVVGENVYGHREAGATPTKAAVEGAHEVARPVTFSILTTITAFVPLLFIPGTTGKYWWPMPAVVITVLAVSLVEALYILPAHLAHGRHRVTRAEAFVNRRQQAVSRGIREGIDRFYSPILAACLRHRYPTLSAALGVLIVVGGYAYSGHMGVVMMPEVAADEIEAGVKLPVGTTPAQAATVAHAVTDSTHAMFEKHELSRVSEGIKTNVRGQSFIDVELVMKPPDERSMSAQEVIELWRDEIGTIEGVDQISFEAERGPGGWRQDLEVDLSHVDIDVLEQASQRFRERLERYEAARDVTDNFDKGASQLDLKLLPTGRNLGLTSADVGQQVRDAFYGALAIRQLRGTSEVEVRVKLPEQERKDLHSFDDFIVRTPAGADVPLRDVVDVQRTEAFTTLTRRNGRRVVTVGMNVQPKRAMTRILDALRLRELPELTSEFPGLTWSFEGTQADMRESTATLGGGFMLAMTVVYALLAIAFGNYLQPLIVMCAIPFGIIGAVIGHLLLGYNLSLVSLMGVIALSGVVVNDSLIMIDFANRVRRRDPDATALGAIHEAGRRRFRPIVLTTLTTAGGLLPMILETSNQARHLIPMAISLGFGILFATLIVLLVVPCLYLVAEDLPGARVEAGANVPDAKPSSAE